MRIERVCMKKVLSTVAHQCLLGPPLGAQDTVQYPELRVRLRSTHRPGTVPAFRAAEGGSWVVAPARVVHRESGGSLPQTARGPFREQGPFLPPFLPTPWGPWWGEAWSSPPPSPPLPVVPRSRCCSELISSPVRG